MGSMLHNITIYSSTMDPMATIRAIWCTRWVPDRSEMVRALSAALLLRLSILVAGFAYACLGAPTDSQDLSGDHSER